MNRKRIRNYSIRGVILARTDYSETDRIIRIFSREFGKISAIGKGVKKSTSKLAGKLELFTIANYGLIKGKKLDIIISAENSISLSGNSINLGCLSRRYLVDKFLNRTLPKASPNPELYEEAEDYFKINCKDKSLFVAYLFLYKAIVLLGFGLSLDECVSCHKRIENQKNFEIDIEKGGMVCSQCHPYKLETISENSLKLLKFITTNSFPIYSKVKRQDLIEKEIKSLIESYVLRINHRELKSTEFIRKINRL